VIDIVWCMTVVQVQTKVVKEGQPVKYLQKYLKDWERHPHFRGISTFFIGLAL